MVAVVLGGSLGSRRQNDQWRFEVVASFGDCACMTSEAYCPWILGFLLLRRGLGNAIAGCGIENAVKGIAWYGPNFAEKEPRRCAKTCEAKHEGLMGAGEDWVVFGVHGEDLVGEGKESHGFWIPSGLNGDWWKQLGY